MNFYKKALGLEIKNRGELRYFPIFVEL